MSGERGESIAHTWGGSKGGSAFAAVLAARASAFTSCALLRGASLARELDSSRSAKQSLSHMARATTSSSLTAHTKQM